jgi:FtsP/CotA-like multicopper oxidase with cupredoxin domain
MSTPRNPVLAAMAVAVLAAAVSCGYAPPAAPSTAASTDMAGMSMSSSASASSTMDAQAMDAAMQASIKAFPAKTQGLGAQDLQPTVLADGTKQYELTAEIVPWEVSPGKTVQAWTYNGTVPGPTIRVNVGDTVQIVLHNHLPESTTIHFHGIQTPFADDGTAFVAQPPVTPGSDFTYAFTPHDVATGMYHSHDDAVKQMPNGMFGAIFVGELATPAGITVTGGDQVFALDDSGVIGLSFNGKSFPATAPYTAKVGQWIEVTYFNAGEMAHPIHLHEFPQLIIAEDGHPVPQPFEKDTINIAPGERYTVLINANIAGVWVWHCHILSHAETDQGMFGMVTALIVQ